MAPRTKLFVGHLPDGLRTEQLSELFSKYGTMTECDVINKYGFVHMATEEQEEQTLKNLNNYNFMGSTLSVERSTSKFHQEPGAPGRAKGRPSPYEYCYHPAYAEWLAFFMKRPPYGGGHGEERLRWTALRRLLQRRTSPVRAPGRPLRTTTPAPQDPPSMGPDMYERRPAPDYALYSHRSPPPASGYSWGAGYGSSDRMGGYSYGGY
ncbi:hypothetical protein MTO96_030324 [Rhipicephalus appendiculatus]